MSQADREAELLSKEEEARERLREAQAEAKDTLEEAEHLEEDDADDESGR